MNVNRSHSVSAKFCAALISESLIMQIMNNLKSIHVLNHLSEAKACKIWNFF